MSITRKAINIPKVGVVVPLGTSQKEVCKLLVDKMSKKEQWDDSTHSHNYALECLKSKRNKVVPFDCDATSRKYLMRLRLQEKLKSR